MHRSAVLTHFRHNYCAATGRARRFARPGIQGRPSEIRSRKTPCHRDPVAGLDPATHVYLHRGGGKTWMAGLDPAKRKFAVHESLNRTDVGQVTGCPSVIVDTISKPRKFELD